MIAAIPSAGDVRSSTRTTTGTSITIPAGRIFTCDVFISGCIAVAGTATPRLVLNGGGTGVEPATGSIVHQLTLNGLALSTVSESGTIELLCRAGTTDATLDFNTGGASSASCTINGFLI